MVHFISPFGDRSLPMSDKVGSVQCRILSMSAGRLLHAGRAPASGHGSGRRCGTSPGRRGTHRTPVPGVFQPAFHVATGFQATTTSPSGKGDPPPPGGRDHAS
jgi:hypothetical protein